MAPIRRKPKRVASNSKGIQKKRRQWDPKTMQAAVNEVVSNKMGYLQASKLFKVPQTTLERFVNSLSVARI